MRYRSVYLLFVFFIIAIAGQLIGCKKQIVTKIQTQTIIIDPAIQTTHTVFDSLKNLFVTRPWTGRFIREIDTLDSMFNMVYSVDTLYLSGTLNIKPYVGISNIAITYNPAAPIPLYDYFNFERLDSLNNRFLYTYDNSSAGNSGASYHKDTLYYYYLTDSIYDRSVMWSSAHTFDETSDVYAPKPH
ncbi:MAG: hypothetical protein JWQ38_3423 [Flavipsychrobacter sp.]|nr:hypothetical protein [Flavipsychrobacter sp.]